MASKQPHSAEKIAYGYVRVSTDKQAKNGVSLEAQQAAIEAHCKARGLTLARMIVDPGISAAKVPLRDRPEGAELLAAIERGDVGVVIVWKIDRAFRNAVETLLAVEDWEDRGVALHLLDLGGMTVDTSTAMGKMFLTMLAGLAEMERNVTSERTVAALAHKKAQGELVGRAPFGMRAAPSGRIKVLQDGTRKPILVLAPDPQEQAALARIRELADLGLGPHRICLALDSEGFKPRGERWNFATVKKSMTEPGLAVSS